MNEALIKIITGFLESHDVMAWNNNSKLDIRLNKFGIVISLSDDQRHPTEMDELIGDLVNELKEANPVYQVKVDKLNGFARLITIT